MAEDLQVNPSIYQALLESTKAIPWRIDWKTMQFTYIGPQIEPLLGWRPESWRSVQDWVDRIHPEDREYVVNFCVSQSKAGVDHEADYRALKQDGSFVWIRDVVHVVREAGEVIALVGFMFDISERKARDEDLMRLQRELEDLSYKDGLTNVANRRRFDMHLAQEWASARRSGRPLALILYDIDFFKDYNDCYGHLAGDDCLKRVAALLAGAAARPRDLAARYGGEEFALLLPETEAEAALAIAEKCLALVREARIQHERSPAGGCLSVSGGVAAMMPAADVPTSVLVSRVDQLLYRAKQLGRNRVCGDTHLPLSAVLRQ